MERRALIIYCDKVGTHLTGPPYDNRNFRSHLKRNIGGNWIESEIKSLRNPTSSLVKDYMDRFVNYADYSLVVFSGHGFINQADNFQYLECADRPICIKEIVSKAPRQTIIIDACSGFFNPEEDEIIKSITEFREFSGERSTRELFDSAVLIAEAGISVLASSGVGEASHDTDFGGAYAVSVLKACENWKQTDTKHQVYTIKQAHEEGTRIMYHDYITIQHPLLYPEKRQRYFPLAVKFVTL